MSDLIDTTEMYLRTVYELQEEGIVPLRARIAERLGQSGPTVSQTAARMERDGLLVVGEDRTLQLTPLGEERAVRVMRKHRLAERLLADVIGLDWSEVHDEACRWEHVISDKAERKLLQLLGHPSESPFGNPIPGLAELDPESPVADLEPAIPLGDVLDREPLQSVVVRIPEWLQEHAEVMSELDRADIRPGAAVEVRRSRGRKVSIATGTGSVLLDADLADFIFVRP